MKDIDIDSVHIDHESDEGICDLWLGVEDGARRIWRRFLGGFVSKINRIRGAKPTFSWRRSSMSWSSASVGFKLDMAVVNQQELVNYLPTLSSRP